MRYGGKNVVRARLLVGGNDIPALVDASEVIDLRDRRGYYEGRLWSSQMPVSVCLEGPLSLVFPDGHTEQIRILGRPPTGGPRNGRVWQYFEASFISDKSFRDAR